MMAIVPGILLCFVIAFPSWYLGRLIPVIGGPVIAITAGIVITMIFPKLGSLKFGPGIKYTSKKLLQYSIVLLGFEMNLYNIIRVGGQSLFIMLFTMSSAFVTAFIVGRLLKLSGNTTVLISVGTSICGGSAIAATAPVINAGDEDVTRAISTIFLFNIIAVFIFPAIGRLMGMNDINFGMWAGTAVNDTSSVVAAATAWSNAAGSNDALQFATVVKLTRTLMIVPVTLFLALYTAGKERKKGAGTFKFFKVFPWFVLFFILVALVNTFMNIPAPVSRTLVTIGKFVITMAMAAIGLSTNLKNLIAHGFKPIILGLSCWVMVAVVSLLVQYFIAY